MTDPIADMLTRIRNALARGRGEVLIPFSKIKFAIAKILEKNEWVTKAEEVSQRPKKARSIRIILKYQEDGPAMRHIYRVSSPGRRIYVGKNEIPRPLGGLGMAIISTSQGLMTDKEARKKGLGGEVICEIY